MRSAVSRWGRWRVLSGNTPTGSTTRVTGFTAQRGARKTGTLNPRRSGGNPNGRDHLDRRTHRARDPRDRCAWLGKRHQRARRFAASWPQKCGKHSITRLIGLSNRAKSYPGVLFSSLDTATMRSEAGKYAPARGVRVTSLTPASVQSRERTGSVSNRNAANFI